MELSLSGRSPRNWNPRNRVAQMAPPLIRMIRCCCTNHHLMECYGIVWMGTPCIFCSTLVALCFCAGRISVKGWNKEGCSLHLQQGRHHTSNKFLEPLNSRLSIKRIYNRISLKWNKILQQFRAIFAKKITTVLLFCIWFFGRVFGIWECVLCNEDITDGVT